jgi:hypothetical protein
MFARYLFKAEVIPAKAGVIDNVAQKGLGGQKNLIDRKHIIPDYPYFGPPHKAWLFRDACKKRSDGPFDLGGWGCGRPPGLRCRSERWIQI